MLDEIDRLVIYGTIENKRLLTQHWNSFLKKLVAQCRQIQDHLTLADTRLIVERIQYEYEQHSMHVFTHISYSIPLDATQINVRA